MLGGCQAWCVGPGPPHSRDRDPETRPPVREWLGCLEPKCAGVDPLLPHLPPPSSHAEVSTVSFSGMPLPQFLHAASPREPGLGRQPDRLGPRLRTRNAGRRSRWVPGTAQVLCTAGSPLRSPAQPPARAASGCTTGSRGGQGRETWRLVLSCRSSSSREGTHACLTPY